MGYIILRKINFTPTPSTSQVVSVKIRKASDPDVDASYTSISSGLAVNADGTLATPLTINDLVDRTAYVVSVKNSCQPNPLLINVITNG